MIKVHILHVLLIGQGSLSGVQVNQESISIA